MNSFAINSDGSIKVAYIKGEIEQMETNYEEIANDTEEEWDAQGTSTKNSDGSRRYVVTNGNNTMYSSNISYRNIIQDYYLPFEFLWAIVVIGDDGSSSAGNSEDLAHAIASMAYDGEIRLIVDDNSSQVITEETTRFYVANYVSYTDVCLIENGHIRGNVEDINEIQDSKPYVSRYVKTENNSSPTLRIRKIEGWSAIYDKTPSYSNNVMRGATEQDRSIDDTSDWTTTDKKFFEYKYADCPEQKLKDALEEKFEINTDQLDNYNLQYNRRIRSRKENITKTSTQNSVAKSYGNASSVTPDFNQDVADLINVSSFSAIKRYITKTSYGSFMEVIEGNTTTANMVDLVNYIFNQVTGTENYGKDMEWDSIWKSSSFSNANDNGLSLSGDTIQERVWMAFKNAGYSDYATAGIMGNIERESGFQPAVTEYSGGGGFGLVQWTVTSVKADLAAYAQSKGVPVEDEELQISFLLGQLDETGQSEACRFAKPEQVINFDRVASKGARACYSGWKNATSVEDATYAFCWFFEGPNEGLAGMDVRYEAANKYYEAYHGRKIGSSGDGGALEESNTSGIGGYYTAKASGNTFTLYYQNIEGTPWCWDCGCFHASQATIASGFGSKLTPNQFYGWLTGGIYTSFSTQAGCQVSREYGISANTMKQYLKDGKAIMIELKYKKLKTDNGSADYEQHFVAVIDYKNENGTDKVYIHDPWSTSPSRGWADLNYIVSISSCFDVVWK